MEVDAKRKLLAKVKAGLDEAVIIIEGKRDERALRETGFAPNAKTVKCGGKNADATARQAVEQKEDGQRVVVLTDFDEEGERRASEITESLLALGTAPDASLRRNFRRLLGVSCVEETPCALARLEEALENKKRKTEK